MHLFPLVLCCLLTLNALATEVIVGMGLSKPPFIMDDGISGAELEIVNRSFILAGLKPKVILVPQARMLEHFKSKLIDSMITVKTLPEGEGVLSETYISYHNIAVSKKVSHLKVDSIADLKNYRIASFQNSQMLLGEDYAKATTKSPIYKEYPRQADQIKMLMADRAELVVLEKNIFAYFAHQNNNSMATFTEHNIFPINHYRVAFHNTPLRDSFNKGLSKLKKTGEHQKILNKYNIKP